MTCVIGIKDNGRVLFGADSCMSNSVFKAECALPKVFRRGELLIGSCGSIRQLNLLQHSFNPPEFRGWDFYRYVSGEFIDSIRQCFGEHGFKRQESDGTESTGGNILVAHKDLLVEIWGDYAFTVPKNPFIAIGSGSLVAMGSLHSTARLGVSAQERLTLALEAAEECSVGVASPFTYLST